MNALQKVFDYQGAQMRTVIHREEPWFVAKDVCEYFRDTNYNRKKATHQKKKSRRE